MTTILIRKGLNGFKYSACGKKGNFLFNTNRIGQITSHWSKEKRIGTVQFIRQLELLPDQEPETAGIEKPGIGNRHAETA